MKSLIHRIKYNFTNNRKVAENYFFMTFLSASTMLIGLILYPYLIRILGKEIYGKYIFICSNIQFFQIFISLGLDVPALKKISLFHNNLDVKTQTISEVFCVKVVLFLLNFLILLIISFFVPFVGENIFIYIIVFCTLSIEILFPTWYFQGIQKMKIVTYINLSARLMTIPLIFIFVKSPIDLMKYVIIATSLPIMSGFFTFFYIRIKDNIKIKVISFDNFKSVIRSAIPFFGTDTFGIIKKESITFIIGTFFNLQDVALYDLANKLILIPRMITTSINAALFPNVIHNNDKNRIKKILQYETYLSIAIIVLIVALGYFAVLLLGGRKMIASYPLAIILSIIIYSWTIAGVYINMVFIPKNRYSFIAKNQFIAMMFFIITSTISLLIYKNLIIIVMLFTMSYFIEVLYCKYLTKKYNLL